MTRRLAAAVLLAGLLIGPLIFSLSRRDAPTLAPETVGDGIYLDPGEALRHGVAPEGVDVSAKLPLSSTLASLSFHSGLPPRLKECLWRFLLAAAVFALGTILDGWPCGLSALLLLILAGPWLPSDGYPEPVFSLLILIAAGALLRRAREPTLRRGVVLAAALGATLLFRSTLAFFPPLFSAADFFRKPRAPARRRRRDLLLLGAAPYLVLVPWLAMNAAVHRAFVPFELGQVSNNAMAGAIGLVTSPDLIQLEPDRPPADRKDAGAVAVWAAREVLGHPGRYAAGVARRLFHVFSLHPLLILGALAGLWLGRRDRGARALGLLWFYLLLIHCAMAIIDRYFAPLWPLSLVLTAGALARFWPKPKPATLPAPQRAAQRVLDGAVAVFAALCLWTGALVAFYPRRREADRRSPQALDAARESRPGDRWLAALRGDRRLDRGDAAGAQADFTQALSLAPSDAELTARLDLAKALQGKPFDPAALPADGEMHEDFSYQVLALIVAKREKDAAAALAAKYRLFRSIAWLPSPERGDPARYDAAVREAFVSQALSPLTRLPARERLAFLRALRPVIPDSTTEPLLEARATVDAGEAAPAEEALSRAAARASSAAERRELARLYAAVKDYRRAGALLSELEEADPQNAELWLAHAEIASAAGDKARLRDCLDRFSGLPAAPEQRARAAALGPRAPKPAAGLDSSLENYDDDPKKAAALLSRLLTSAPLRDPKNYRLRLKVAELAQAAGNEKLARAALKDLPPEKLETSELRRLAGLCARLKDDALGWETLRALTAREPDDAELFLERAEWADRLGRRADAGAALSRVAGPGLTAALAARAATLAWDLKDKPRALDFLARAQAKSPGEADAHQIAILYQELGRCDRALPLLRGLLARAPKAAYWSDVGVCEDLGGNLPEAVRGFEQALRLDPSWIPASLSLGSIYERQGRTADALAVYDEALRRPPAPGNETLAAILRKARADLAAQGRR